MIILTVFVHYSFVLFKVALFIYILSSWLPNVRDTKFISLIGRIVEPYLRLFRFIPPLGAIDISPIVAIFVLSWIERFLALGLLMLVSAF